MPEVPLPNLRESDFIIRDFRFASGETLPELRQHSITLGLPNAPSPVLLIDKDSTGTAKSWLEPSLAWRTVRPGPAADATRISSSLGYHRLWRLEQAKRWAAARAFRTFGSMTWLVAQHRLLTEGFDGFLTSSW